MRLNSFEVDSIVDVFKEVFQRGEIYLFGSRVDDNKKGGDIDLYLVVEKKDISLKKKIDFLIKLHDKIGEQKIDIVFSKDPKRQIEQEAIKKGIQLWTAY